MKSLKLLLFSYFIVFMSVVSFKFVVGYLPRDWFGSIHSPNLFLLLVIFLLSGYFWALFLTTDINLLIKTMIKLFKNILLFFKKPKYKIGKKIKIYGEINTISSYHKCYKMNLIMYHFKETNFSYSEELINHYENTN